jgi:lipopolysaccharide biosynthesis glycosyltransferase
MIGVTLSSPGFEELAEESRKRFMRHTGLQCVVVHTRTPQNYAAKLELPRMFNQTVVWFDADLWFVRDVDLSEFDDQPEFFAVLDPGIHDLDHFPLHDSRTLNLDHLKYFNSGFFIWNSRHHAAFEEARRVMANDIRKLKDFGEQSALNAGVQRTCKLKLLSSTLNYMPFAELHNMRGLVRQTEPATIHAAGYGTEHKLPALQYYEARYSRKYLV